MDSRANCEIMRQLTPQFISPSLHRNLSYTPHVPVMAASLTDRLWSVEELVALWESYEQRRLERAA